MSSSTKKKPLEDSLLFESYEIIMMIVNVLLLNVVVFVVVVVVAAAGCQLNATAAYAAAAFFLLITLLLLLLFYRLMRLFANGFLPTLLCDAFCHLSFSMNGKFVCHYPDICRQLKCEIYKICCFSSLTHTMYITHTTWSNSVPFCKLSHFSF